MREIKFRVWVNKRKKYLQKDESYVLPVINQGKLLVGIDYNNKMFMGDVLEQYTGLKDIHGVEIYEGDEIEFNGTKGKVEWDNNTASFRFKSYTSIYSLAFSKYNIINIEVIGNIHER